MKGAVAGLSLTIVSLEPIADSSSVVSMPNGAVDYESESVCLFHGCLRRTADKREHQNKGQNQCELFHKTTSYDDVRICGCADGYGGANEFVL